MVTTINCTLWPITIETSASSLHYGISVHEGISVFKNKDSGKMQGFRVHDHLASFNSASTHLDMPMFNETELLDCINNFLSLIKTG